MPASSTEAQLGWLSAQAPWPAGVSAGVTLRSGGVSLPPWDSFNLGDHVGDAPAHVLGNRARLARTLGRRPVFLQQVHGCTALELLADCPDGQRADACWSNSAALACTVLVADCLPLLLAAPDGRSVAAVHAGWRGLAGVPAAGAEAEAAAQGVLEALCQVWPAARPPAARAEVVVWLGPCIGPQAFEVGPEVRAAFVPTCAGDAAQASAACFARLLAPGPGGEAAPKYLCDLAALARLRLQRLGFARLYGNDSSPPWCTLGQPSRFFSHRRDAARLGASGRMAACIGARA